MSQNVKWMTNSEFEEQLAALTPYPKLRAIVATYIYAGLRREEASWLTVGDIDLRPRGMIHVRARYDDGPRWETKTGKDRVVPINSKLRAEIVSYMATHSGKWAFPAANGGRWQPHKITACLHRVNYRHHLHWKIHDFRYTFAHNLAQMF